VRADQDRRAAAREHADDVAQAGVSAHGLEAPAGQGGAQAQGQPAQDARAGGPRA
jgi:hypothetical protein